MKKTIRLLVALAGMLSITVLGSQFAQAREGKECCEHAKEHHCHYRHHRHHRFEKMAEKLGLSEQQKTKMKEIFKQNREQAKPVIARLFTEKHNLRELVHADKTDDAAIRAQAAKVAGIEGDLAVHRAHMLKQVRAILTPAQAEKFRSLQKEREQRFEEFRKHHMDRRSDKAGPEQ